MSGPLVRSSYRAGRLYQQAVERPVSEHRSAADRPALTDVSLAETFHRPTYAPVTRARVQLEA